jgi:hypothetical protein
MDSPDICLYVSKTEHSAVTYLLKKKLFDRGFLLFCLLRSSLTLCRSPPLTLQETPNRVI